MMVEFGTVNDQELIIPEVWVRHGMVHRRRRRRVLMVLHVVRRVVRREVVVLAVLALAAERAQRHRHVGHFVTEPSPRANFTLPCMLCAPGTCPKVYKLFLFYYTFLTLIF